MCMPTGTKKYMYCHVAIFAISMFSIMIIVIQIYTSLTCTADSGMIYLMKGIESQHWTSLLEHLRDENNEHWQVNVRSWYWQNDIYDQDKLVLKTDRSDILETWQPLLVNRDWYLFYDTSTFQKVPIFRYATKTWLKIWRTLDVVMWCWNYFSLKIYDWDD